MNKYLMVFVLTVSLIFTGLPLLSAEESATEEFTLEEITVTAQKREENQQKVPIAMDVITSDEIKELGKNDLTEILANVSSALIQKAADGLRVSIRGISDDSSSKMGQSQAIPSVAVNTDGVYSNRKDTGASLFDIERVEVLYGPQSTMYASNSPGGIINVVTANPKTDKFEVSGALEVGNYNLLHTEGVVNVPLSDKVAVRTSFTTSKRDGYLDNGTDNEDTKSARFRALFKPNENMSFTGTAEVSKNKGAGFSGGVVIFVHQDDDYYPDGTKLSDPWTSADNEAVSFNDQTARKFSGQFNWDMGYIGSLSLIPSYSTRSGKSIMTMMSELQHSTQRSREKGVELRMTSSSDFFFKWIAGATYYKSSDFQSNFSQTYIDSGAGSYTIRDMKNNNHAFFANITYPIIDTFRLTVGYRQSWDEIISDNEEYRESMADPGTYEAADEYMVQENPGKPDWKFGFEYDLADNSMLYGDYSTSYRVQGMSMTSTDPEKLKSYQIGAKNRFLENKLQVNAAAYYYDYTNYQASNMIQIWVSDANENGVQDPGEGATEPNAAGVGDGSMIGVDLQTSWIITSKDQLNLSVSYEKSEWEDLEFDYYYDGTYTTDDEGNVVWEEIEDETYTGKPMFSTPPWTVNLNYSHNFTLPNGGSLKATLTSKYQTGYRMSWKNSDYPNNWQETHHMEDANVSYNHPNGVWTLSAYVKNIFNYAEKTFFMGGGMNSLSIGAPRTYGAVLSVRF